MKELLYCAIVLGVVMTFGLVSSSRGGETESQMASMHLGERTRLMQAEGRLPATDLVEVCPAQVGLADWQMP